MFFRKKRIAEPKLDFNIDKPIEYYADMLSDCGGTEEILFELHLGNTAVSKMVLQIYPQSRKEKLNKILIHNFETLPNLTDNGFGTKLLKNTAEALRKINDTTENKTFSLYGSLVHKDLEYWQYSLPMYLKLAQNIMGEDIVCLINGNPVENENMVSEAYNLNKQKIAVRFEFRKANIL